MRKKTSKKQNVKSTETDNRCIWMTAGVISYKLCPYDYDCEHCDLDKAMRSQVRSRKIKSKTERNISQSVMRPEPFARISRDSKSPSLFFTFIASELKEGLYLHPAHLWAWQIEDQKWRVGVDELLSYILPPPSKLEFSDLNKNLSQNQVFGKILSSAGTVFLTSPLTGSLVRVNPRLEQNPDLVQQDPYGEGWLVAIDRIKDRTELEDFFTGVDAKRYLQEEAKHLNFFLRRRGVEVNQIGVTLPDGGVNIKYLNQVLPAKVCFRLAIELMVTGKQGW